MRRARAYLASLSKEEVQRLIDRFETRTQLAVHLGLRGGSLKILNEFLLAGDFTFDKWGAFTTKGRKGQRTPESNARLGKITQEKFRLKFEKEKLPLLLVENCTLSNISARKLIHQWNWYYNWLEEECQKCTLGKVWQGEPLTLQVEHKNGVANDNRIENLCFLCPNCHSQTKTHGWRNYHRKKKKKLDPPE